MFVGLRDLRRGGRRFLLLGLVVALVSLLSTVLSGLATGLVTDGISGLRALPFDRVVLQNGSEATFSRSTLREKDVQHLIDDKDLETSPLGASFVNATSDAGGPSLDLALFGVPADSFLVHREEARKALAGKPGLVLAGELEDDGVKVGDKYTLGGSDVELPVLGFTYAGTYGHAPIGFVSLETWQKIQYGANGDGRFSALAVSGNGGDIERFGKADHLDVLTKNQAYAGSPGFTAETTTMSLIRSFLLVISALVVGAFFTVLMVQRTRQIGLMKALGASNGYIARDSVGQMTVLVTIATLAGVGIGAAIVAFLQGGSAPVELNLRAVLGVAGSLIIAGIVGSLVAVRRITNVEPAIALGVES